MGRPFNLYTLGVNGKDDKLVWSSVLNPGDAIVMTLEANLLTKHEVPLAPGGEIGDSGSIVLRTISTLYTPSELKLKIRGAETSKVAREKAKAAEKVKRARMS